MTGQFVPWTGWRKPTIRATATEQLAKLEAAYRDGTIRPDDPLARLLRATFTDIINQRKAKGK